MGKPSVAYERILDVVYDLVVSGKPEFRPKDVKSHWDYVYPDRRPPSVQTILAQFTRMVNDGVLAKTKDGWVVTKDKEDAPPAPADIVEPTVAMVDDSGWVDIVPAHVSGEVNYVVAVRNAMHNKTPAIIFRFNADKTPHFKNVRIRINPTAGLVRFEEDPAGYKVLQPGPSNKSSQPYIRVAGKQAIELAKLFENMPNGVKKGETRELVLVSEKTGRTLELQL